MTRNASSIWEQAAADADLTVTLPGKVKMFFRRIPAGEFMMGSRGGYHDEEPRHRVKIENDFFLGTFVVTQQQYATVACECDALRKRSDPSHFKGARRPVEQVNWREANTLCDWLTRNVPASKLPKGYNQFCLPTEAEWEFACRAGTETDYYNGDGAAALGQVGWYGETSGNQTHAVEAPPQRHPHGLFGMHGNVREWCHDPYEAGAYREHAEGAPDSACGLRRQEWDAGLPQLIREDDDRLRVLRGGSWDNTAWGCRSAYRNWWRPDDRLGSLGFRVCLVRGPVPQQAEQPAESEPATGVAGRGTRPETDGVGADGAGGRRGEVGGKRGQRAEDGEGIDLGAVRFPRRGLPDGPGRKEGQ